MAKTPAWVRRHESVWAATVQGEGIRIPGRLAHESDGADGEHWDDDFDRMAQAFAAYVATAIRRTHRSFAQVAEDVAGVRRKPGAPARVCAMAVAWVTRKPSPIPLPPPDHRR